MPRSSSMRARASPPRRASAWSAASTAMTTAPRHATSAPCARPVPMRRAARAARWRWSRLGRSNWWQARATRRGVPRRPLRRYGSRARANCGSAAKIMTASTCFLRRSPTRRATLRCSRCACRSAMPPRWWRWSARASTRPRWSSCMAATPRCACRSGRSGGPMSTSRCWRCAGACMKCHGIRSLPGAGASPASGGAPSAAKAANMPRRRHWSTCPSRLSGWGWPRSGWAMPDIGSMSR
ncbi:hypothetical protein D9M72_455330 [compost metagenome]